MTSTTARVACVIVDEPNLNITVVARGDKVPALPPPAGEFLGTVIAALIRARQKHIQGQDTVGQG